MWHVGHSAHTQAYTWRNDSKVPSTIIASKLLFQVFLSRFFCFLHHSRGKLLRSIEAAEDAWHLSAEAAVRNHRQGHNSLLRIYAGKGWNGDTGACCGKSVGQTRTTLNFAQFQSLNLFKHSQHSPGGLPSLLMEVDKQSLLNAESTPSA